MPKLTYAQIRELQDRYGQDNVSTDEYAKYLNDAFGTNDYNAGRGTGFGKFLKGTSYLIDQGINATGIPDAIGNVVEGLGGAPDTVEAFKGMPRAIVDFAPAAFGPLGMAAAALLSGANAYEKTDSVGAGLASAALIPMLGPVGGLGKTVGLNLAKRMGFNMARTQGLAAAESVAAKAGLSAIGRLNKKLSESMGVNMVSLMQGGQFVSKATNTAAFLGHEASVFGALTASNAVSAAIGAEPGQGWDAAGEALSGRSLFLNAITQLPFTAVGLKRQMKTPSDVGFIRDHAKTFEDYLKDPVQFPTYVTKGEPQLQTYMEPGWKSPETLRQEAEAKRIAAETAAEQAKQAAKASATQKPASPQTEFDFSLGFDPIETPVVPEVAPSLLDPLTPRPISKATGVVGEAPTFQQDVDGTYVSTDLNAPAWVEANKDKFTSSTVVEQDGKTFVKVRFKEATPTELNPETPKIRLIDTVRDDVAAALTSHGYTVDSTKPIMLRGLDNPAKLLLVEHPKQEVALAAALEVNETPPSELKVEADNMRKEGMLDDDIVNAIKEGQKSKAKYKIARDEEAKKKRAVRAAEREAGVVRMNQETKDRWARWNEVQPKDKLVPFEAGDGTMKNRLVPGDVPFDVAQVREALSKLDANAEVATADRILQAWEAWKETGDGKPASLGSYIKNAINNEKKTKKQQGTRVTYRGHDAQGKAILTRGKLTGKDAKLGEYRLPTDPVEVDKLKARLEQENPGMIFNPDYKGGKIPVMVGFDKKVRVAAEGAVEKLSNENQVVNSTVYGASSPAERRAAVVLKDAVELESPETLVEGFTDKDAFEVDSDAPPELTKLRLVEVAAWMKSVREAPPEPKPTAEQKAEDKSFAESALSKSPAGQIVAKLKLSKIAKEFGIPFDGVVAKFKKDAEGNLHLVPLSERIADMRRTASMQGLIKSGSFESVSDVYEFMHRASDHLNDYLTSKALYVGPKALSPEMDMRHRTAIAMLNAGKGAEEVRRATGWFQGELDGKWRWETQDQNAQLNTDWDVVSNRVRTLEHVLDHPELFKLYPELKKLKVKLQPSDSWSGYYSHEDNVLGLSESLPQDEVLSTILHEVQHFIQHKEGFALGGNKETVFNSLSPERFNWHIDQVKQEYNVELSKYTIEREVFQNTIGLIESKGGQVKKAFDPAGSTREAELLQRIGDRFNWNNEKVVSYLKDNLSDYASTVRKLSKAVKTLSDLDNASVAQITKLLGNSDTAFKLYENIAGEIEARDVSNRMGYSELERKANQPLTSEEFDRANVTRIFDLNEPEFSQTHPSDLLSRLRDVKSETVPQPFIGNRETMAGILAKSDFNDPMHLEEATKIATMLDQPISLHTLNDPTKAGLFAVTRTGEQIVALSAGKHMGPELFMFAAAHEYNGHGFWEAFKNGKLKPDDANRVQRFSDMVAANKPEENAMMLDQMRKILPERYQKDATLAKLMESTSGDHEEVMANVNAMVSLTLANAPRSAIRDMVSHLPKPIADLFFAIAKYSKKIFDAVIGVNYLRKLGMTEGAFDPQKYKTLNEYVKTLNEVLKVEQDHQKAAATLMRMQALSEPGYFADIMNSDQRESFLATSVAEHADVYEAAKFLDLLPKERKYGQGGWFDHSIGLLTNLGLKFPELRDFTMLSSQREARHNLVTNEVFRVMGIERGTGLASAQYVHAKDSASYKVEIDTRMASVRDMLQRYVNKIPGQTIDGLVQKGDPEVQRLLNIETDAGKRKLILQAIQQSNQAHLVMVKNVHELRREGLQYRLAEILMMRDSTLTKDSALSKVQGFMRGRAQGIQMMSMGDPNLDVTAIKLLDKLESDNRYFLSNPSYITEQRTGDYRFKIHWGPKDVETRAAVSEYDFNNMMEALLKDPRKPRVEMLQEASQADVFKSKAMEDLIAREQAYALEMKTEFIAAGVDPMLVDQIVDGNNLISHLKMEEAVSIVGKEAPKKRGFKPGRNTLDMMHQQINWVQRVSRGLTKSVADAQFNMMKRDPNIREHPEMPTIEQAWRNYKTPDPSLVSKISGLNYVMNLAGNFFNMLQDASQPLLGMLPGNLVSEGAGVTQAYKHVSTAMADVLGHVTGSKPLTGERLKVWDEFKRSNSAIGSYDTTWNNDAMEAIATRYKLEGRQATSVLEDYVQKPWFWLVNKGKGLGKIFTDYGAQASILASYDFYRSQGLPHAEAHKKAFAMEKISNASAGRGGRAVNMWNNAAWRPVSAMVTGLQTYATNVISTLKIHMQKGFFSYGENSSEARKRFSDLFGGTGELTQAQRIQARKAFAMGLGSTIAVAGLLGVPGVGAMLKGAEALGWNAKADLMQALSNDDDPENSVMQLMLLHGAGNLVGFDVGSRMGVNGLLGVNSYQGFDPGALFGPTGGLIKSAGQSLSDLAHGDVGQALERVAPSFFKRPLKLYRDDWEFRDSDGTKLIDSTPTQAALYSILGLKPNQLSAVEEMRALQQADRVIKKEANSRWVNDQAAKLASGEVSEVKQSILERTIEEPNTSSDALMELIAEQMVDRTMPYNPAMSGVSGLASAGPGGLARPDQLQRYQMSLQVKRMLGGKLPKNPKAVARRTSQLTAMDRMLGMNPMLSVQEARQQL